jgi:hypothetical protein
LNDVTAIIRPTIAVRAAAAVIGPAVRSVMSVTTHNRAVRSTQTKARRRDVDLMETSVRHGWLVKRLSQLA